MSQVPNAQGPMNELSMLQQQYQTGFGGQLSDKRSYERYRNRVAQLEAIEKQKARQELYRNKTRERVAARKAAKAAKTASPAPAAAPTPAASAPTSAPQSTQTASPVKPSAPQPRDLSQIAALPTNASPPGAQFDTNRMISDMVARARAEAAKTPTGQLAAVAAPASSPAAPAVSAQAPFNPAQAARSLSTAAGRSLNPASEPLTANLNVEALSGLTDAEAAPSINLGSPGQMQGTLLDIASRIPGLGINRPVGGFSGQAAAADVAERNAVDDAVRAAFTQASAGLDPNTASGKAAIGQRLGQILSSMPNGPIGSPERFARDKLVSAFVRQYPELSQIAYPSTTIANDPRYADLLLNQQSLAPGSVAGNFSMGGKTDFERAASNPSGTIGPTPAPLPAGTPAPVQFEPNAFGRMDLEALDRANANRAIDYMEANPNRFRRPSQFEPNYFGRMDAELADLATANAAIDAMPPAPRPQFEPNAFGREDAERFDRDTANAAIDAQEAANPPRPVGDYFDRMAFEQLDRERANAAIGAQEAANPSQPLLDVIGDEARFLDEAGRVRQEVEAAKADRNRRLVAERLRAQGRIPPAERRALLQDQRLQEGMTEAGRPLPIPAEEQRALDIEAERMRRINDLFRPGPPARAPSNRVTPLRPPSQFFRQNALPF